MKLFLCWPVSHRSGDIQAPFLPKFLILSSETSLLILWNGSQGITLT